jgi:hypothetical protein
MTDPETPAFNVVDRRSAAQAAPNASADHPARSAEGVHADTSSPTGNDYPAAPIQAPGTSAAAEHNASGESESGAPETGSGADMPMPDPAALLAYVAMQMDVKALASTLLGVFSGQAWRAMGLIANPATGESEKNLPEAQIAIDCVQFLLGKIENDLDASDRREIQRRLNDLRMNYLAKMREG